MLIKFNILWIEDNEKFLQSTKNTIQKYLEDLGFHLEDTIITDPSKIKVDNYLDNTSNYDLILVDWQFKQNSSKGVQKKLGGKIIEKIRNKTPYADIIFYSSVRSFIKDISRKHLDGVYTCTRINLRREIKDLIEHLLRKTLHPKTMRGVIVSELSNIDDLCYQIIKKKCADPSGGESLIASIKESIEENAKEQCEGKMKLIQKNDIDFVEELHSTMQFDSHKRALKVEKCAKSDNISNDILEPISRLPDTIRKRNKLAHWKRKKETDNYIILEESGKPDYKFDQKEAADMRKSINNAAEALREYLNSL